MLTEEEALTTFAANSIVVPSADGASPATVVMPAAPDHVRDQLEAWGFAVELVDVSEFHKAGGSIRCLTNPVDIQIGRDLPVVRRRQRGAAAGLSGGGDPEPLADAHPPRRRPPPTCAVASPPCSRSAAWA